MKRFKKPEQHLKTYRTAEMIIESNEEERKILFNEVDTQNIIFFSAVSRLKTEWCLVVYMCLAGWLEEKYTLRKEENDSKETPKNPLGLSVDRDHHHSSMVESKHKLLQKSIFRRQVLQIWNSDEFLGNCSIANTVLDRSLIPFVQLLCFPTSKDQILF